MSYMTDRKRAEGLGSAKSGTDHFYDEVVAYYSKPFPAIVAGLTFVVGWVHFKSGAQTMIEDYSHGTARHVAIIAVTCISYAAIAAGLFALVRLAL